jgi:hypothetical protein
MRPETPQGLSPWLVRDASPAGRSGATAWKRRNAVVDGAVTAVATGGNMPTNTPPNQETVEREPRGKRSAPEEPRPAPSKGAAEADAAQQREREKRIERFRER